MHDRHGERPAHHLAHRRGRRQRQDVDLRWLGGERSDGSLVLRGRIRRPRAGSAQPPEHVVEQTVRGVVGDLHLELAEPCGDAAPRQYRHLVVDHLAQEPVVEIQQLGQPTDRAQTNDGPERGRPDVRADQVDRFVGRCRRVVPGERELSSDQEVAAPFLGRKLRGPPLALAMTDAHSPAREAEVGSVEVDGLQPLRIVRDGQDVVAQTFERGHPERRRCGELHLALGGRRHLALSSARCCR